MDCYYVDKTAHVLRLTREGKYHFLSRPRRFGKSLLVDTLKELFEGNGELFRGLVIHGEWDWSVKHPVVRFDFSGGEFGDPEGLRHAVTRQLDVIGEEAGITPRYADPPGRFDHLIRALRRSTGRQVVVLVDEYDKPILDALAEPEVARANRNVLRSLYGVIKTCDADIRFCFLTGVSKFSKAGLFSGLNNLRDITLDRRYGTICGYTDADLDTVFAPELGNLDRDEVRRWYNGYSWLGEGKVYNPFDILLLFDKREFGNYWFETGTPTFLVDLLARRGIDALSLEGRVADDTLLSAFDVDRIEPEALLFQTGYLTITGEERDGDGIPLHARLSEPRGEAQPERGPARGDGAGSSRRLRNGGTCNAFCRRTTSRASRDCSARSSRGSRTNGTRGRAWRGTRRITRACSTPTSLQRGWMCGPRRAARTAGRTWPCCSTPTYTCSSSNWRIGNRRALHWPGSGAGYADKYRGLGWPIHLIGVEFGREERNIVAFSVEAA